MDSQCRPAHVYYSLWQELGVVPHTTMIYHNIFHTFRDTSGRTLNLYTNADKLEQELLSLSPADAQEIKTLCTAIKQHVPFIRATGKNPLRSISRTVGILWAIPLLKKYGSMNMAEYAARYIEISQREGGVFCGIYDAADDRMIGVVDYVPCGFQGDPHLAHLSLLMIAVPFRQRGVGKAVIEAIEQEITKGTQITAILSGVQVNNPQAVQFWQRRGYRIVSGPTLMADQTTVFEIRKELYH